MLNIKVTNRMTHEDFVAHTDATPFILPRKHILGVGSVVIVCAVLVLPMPSTWERFSENSASIRAGEEAYLATDQSSNEYAAQNQTVGTHQENYEDYDIPSRYFSSSTPADPDTLDQIFEGAKDTVNAVLGNTVEGTWADGTKEAVEGTSDEDDDELIASEGATQEVYQRPTGTWYRQTVRRGDSLSGIFTYLNLPYATLNRVTKVAKKRDLRLNIGDPIYFLIDDDNVVKEMVKPISKTQQVRFTRLTATDDFHVVYEAIGSHAEESALAAISNADKMPLAVQAAKERAERDALAAKQLAERIALEKAMNKNPNRPRLIINEIKKGESFKTAAHRAGLTPSEIRSINDIFKNKIATTKLKAGDKFRVLFSGIGTDALIYAVRLDTSKGSFETFMNPEDRNYYGENEYTPTAGIFRRFPLAGEVKVNSHFNPQRRHPVTRRISPHNGVDFKAAVGTPIYAPADGTVTFSGYQRAAGYYVIVSHANNFSTVYMHLSKAEVKMGQKVIVGQLIARSGNTGRTTGPHLHYEIRINDRPVDPLKIDLPSSNHPNLAREQREAFANNVKILRADLKNDNLALSKTK